MNESSKLSLGLAYFISTSTDERDTLCTEYDKLNLSIDKYTSIEYDGGLKGRLSEDNITLDRLLIPIPYEDHCVGICTLDDWQTDINDLNQYIPCISTFAEYEKKLEPLI